MKPQGHIPASAPPGAHETAEVDPRLIFRVATFIGTTLVILLILLALLFGHWEGKYADRTSEAAPRVRSADLPPTPRLQTDPRRDLQAVQAEENLHLTSYGWVGGKHAFAQIPIDRAMDLWVRDQAAAMTNAAPGNALPPAPVTELEIRQQKAQEGSRVP